MATAKNTQGAITKAVAAQTAAKPQSPAQILNNMLNNKSIQGMLESALGENKGAFTASVLNLFNSDTALQQCEQGAIIKEALKAAALKLPVEKSLGLAYIIPYKQNGVMVPQFQLGYKGMLQLCMRSGVYKYLNAGVVYEGEYIGCNKLTGEIDISGTKTSDTVVGYFAYLETKNGFIKSEYWTKDEVIKHAQRFSKSYKYGGVWASDFDSMAIKTVTKSLLSKYGVMSVEIMQAFTEEAGGEAYDDAEATTDNTTIEVITDGNVREAAEITADTSKEESSV